MSSLSTGKETIGPFSKKPMIFHSMDGNKFVHFRVNFLVATVYKIYIIIGNVNQRKEVRECVVHGRAAKNGQG